jgi:small subunit ribosomal protein S17
MSEETTTTVDSTPATEAAPTGIRKERIGQVVSTKMHKTIIVEIITRVPHAKYGKIVKKRKRFYAHDEKEQAQDGDVVRIEETRPLSKLKRWRLVEVLKH